MARKLAAYVHVHDEGVTTVYGPEDDVPASAAKLIANEKAWAEAPAEESDDEPIGGPPPKGGKGSGAEAWQEYADANDVEYADDATRDDIIAACEAADVPTE